MKRDILDDYRDFLMAVRDKMQFEMHPRRAYIDKDGEVAQEMVIKCVTPGFGITHGAAVIWFPQWMFPHGNYLEPCDTEMLFQQQEQECDDESALGNWEPPIPNPEDELYEDEAAEDPFMDQGFVDYLNELLSL